MATPEQPPGLAWAWSGAALGTSYAIPAAIVAATDVRKGVALAVGVLPATIIGLPARRRGRVVLAALGFLAGVPMVVGSVLAGVPTLAVIAIALAGVAAAGAAARSPIGTESGRPSSTASCSGSPARPPRRSAFSLISSTSAGQPVPRCWSCAPVRTCNDYAASAACSQSSPVLSLGPRSSERHLAGVVQHRRPGGARRGGGHQRQSLVRRPGLHHRTRVPITPVRRPRQRRAPLSRTRGRNRPRSGAGIFLRAGGAEAARTVAWPRAPGLTVDEQFLDRSGGSGLNHRVGPHNRGRAHFERAVTMVT